MRINKNHVEVIPRETIDEKENILRFQERYSQLSIKTRYQQNGNDFWSKSKKKDIFYWISESFLFVIVVASSPIFNRKMD